MAGYVAAADLAEARALLARHGSAASLLAGGQSLLPLRWQRSTSRPLLVDITRIPALRTLEVRADCIRLGAAVTLTELMEHATLASALPALGVAVAAVGSRAIRNRSTVGGTLAWADARGELVLAALALDARIETTHGVHAARSFIRGPRETALAADEIITALLLPRRPECHSAFEEQTLRRGGGRALAAVMATAVRGTAGSVDCAVTVAGVAAQAMRLPLGTASGPPARVLDRCVDTLRAAVASLPAGDDPLIGIDYRRRLAVTLGQRALARALQAAGSPA